MEIWDGAAGAEVLFRTRTEDGTVVIDRGLATVTPLTGGRPGPGTRSDARSMRGLLWGSIDLDHR